MAVKNRRTFFGYLAKTTNDGKVFARKLTRVGHFGVKDEDVENEARVLKSLYRKGQHDNLIQVLQHGWLESAGKIYFIDMELADLSLHDYIRYVFSSQLLPSNIRVGNEFDPVFSQRDCSELERIHTTWAISRHIAEGLDFMHKGGHVHRDLKPHNGKSFLRFFSG